MNRVRATTATNNPKRLILQPTAVTPAPSLHGYPSTRQQLILQMQKAVGNRATRLFLASGQQFAGSAVRYVQRYESGEHAKLGESQTELQSAFAPGSYVVLKGDTVESIAAKTGLTVPELKEANKDKLTTLPAKGKSAPAQKGFTEGQSLSIPKKLNDLAKAAVKDKAAKFTVNGVVMDYGVGIAMGDLFENPAQMAQASPQELEELRDLILREKAGQNVTQAEWERASKGRYLKLAAANNSHFGPQNPKFAPPTAAGASSANHQGTWQQNHESALRASQQGDKDQALAINSFADHFLTDAFAAGHLFNKADVMGNFKNQLKVNKDGDFLPASEAFFNQVAASAFTGAVAKEFSQYETVEWRGVIFRPNIDRVSRFSTLLQGIYKKEPDLLANSVVKGIHDHLNTLPGGLPVENAKGDKWNLSGDGTLNADTTKVAHQAVAQSQLNVISVFSQSGPLDLPQLFQKVWDFTPRPTAAGTAQVSDAVTKGTDINNAALKDAVVNLIKENYKLILDGLVSRNILKKA
jgi:LysM repeat protein